MACLLKLALLPGGWQMDERIWMHHGDRTKPEGKDKNGNNLEMLCGLHDLSDDAQIEFATYLKFHISNLHLKSEYCVDINML